MTVRYNYPSSGPAPMYVCQRARIQRGEPVCQIVPGTSVDEAVGKLLVEIVTPITLEVALEVDEELRRRAEEVEPPTAPARGASSLRSGAGGAEVPADRRAT